MKVRPSSLIIIVVLLASVLSACGFGGEEPTPEPVPVAVTQPNVVSAEAFVVPVREADLAFQVGGQVQSLQVEEGEEVKQGQLLAELENSTQQAAVSEAEAAVSKAEAGLKNAEANLAQAEAQLTDTKAGATPEEIAQAQADVARAEAALAETLSGATPGEVAEAEARVETARANLAQVLAGSRDEDINAAAAQMLQAEADVREAQADYDANVFGEPDRLGPYGLALQQATLTYQQAEAEYNKVVNGATDEEIAVSRAQLNEAQAALQHVRDGATPEQVAQAQAEVEAAQAALDRTKAGATDTKVAISEAGVQVAQAGVESAKSDIQSAEAGLGSTQAELDKTQLTAPFDGVVGSLTIEEGEIVQGGSTVASVGDPTKWQIETDDLTEIDVVRVKEGASVTISVDALPNQEFKGVVTRITPKSETKAGDVTYTVLIDITEGDTARLRWGMTTFVDIEASPEL